MIHSDAVSFRSRKVPLHWKLLVGAVSGGIGMVAIYPIDMMKTRLQATQTPLSGSVALKTVKDIVQNEGGYRALYRGLAPVMLGIIPEKAIQLALNEQLRDMFQRSDGSILVHDEVIAAACAGVGQCVVKNPTEVLKIRLQMQEKQPKRYLKLTPIEMVKRLGFRGLFNGTIATMCRDVPFSILFFPMYARIKKALGDRDTGKNSILSVVTAGVIAGGLCGGAVTPFDVVKTRLQLPGGWKKYRNVLHGSRLVVRHEGLQALCKGALQRSVVMSALFSITLLSFEVQKDLYFSTQS